MITAIIGLGRIGSPLAQEIVAGGQAVVLVARDQSKATALANRLGPLASIASIQEAIARADVVIVAVPFDVIKEIAVRFGDLLKGKIVVDPSNPVAPDENGRLQRVLPEGQSSGSVIAGLLPRRRPLRKGPRNLVRRVTCSGDASDSPPRGPVLRNG